MIEPITHESNCGVFDPLVDRDCDCGADGLNAAAHLVAEEEAEGFDFELDLTDLPEVDPGKAYAAGSGPSAAAAGVTPEERLERLLEPFSYETQDKARKLLERGSVELFKKEGQSQWFNVRGSTLYVTKVTRGEDFLFAECSCPNGVHRGGEAICYHSIAARVAEAGLTEAWLS